MLEVNTRDFDSIKNEMFMLIYKNDKNFDNELKFFINNDKNYDKESYRQAILIIDDLISNYILNNFIYKIRLLKLQAKPMLKGVKSDKYINNGRDIYNSLLDFEDNYFKFLNARMKENIICKKHYKKATQEYDEIRNSKNFYNLYVTLKSLNALQIEANKKLISYDVHLDSFIENFNYKHFKIDGFKPEDLDFYFNTLISDKKKKVKHLHY